VFLTEERLDKAEGFFDRRGAIVITFARFVEGLRQANGIIAGITGMHWRRFLVFNALGAALWVGTWVSLGYLAGDHITTICHYITVYSYYVLIAVAVFVLAYVAWRLRRRRRRHTPAAASRADETHESTRTTEAAGIAPGEPGRGAHASPGREAEEHPPAGHQHGETTPGEQVAPRHDRDGHAPDKS
jgi:ABC-type nickel/cobalt efflux system permease component RcnA